MSNTVDNRVVQMQFKNEDFERGVKQTITSLDSLKKALEINTSSLNLSNVRHELDSMNIANVSNAIDNLSSRFSNLGVVGMTVLQNLTNKAIEFAERMYSVSIGQVFTGGKNRAQKVADARFKLEGLLEDGAKVESVFTAASDAVNDTAFGLDEAANIASMLVGSGVEFERVGDQASKLDNALMGIAGAAAMSNSSFEDIGRIFAQVKTAGRLMGQDMMQLQGRTINVVAELAKYLKLSQAEVQEMVHKGQIDFDTFAEAMNNSFGKQAKKSNETLQGVLANVRAALSRIGEIFYSGIIENKRLIEFFNVLKTRISEIQGVLKHFKGPFYNFIAALSNVGIAILNIFKLGQSKRFDAIIDVLAFGLDKISDFIDRIAKALNTFVKDTHIDEAAKEVKETVDDIAKATDKVKDIANTIWFGKNIYGNGKARKNALGDMYDQVQGYVNAMKEANFDMAKADEIYAKTTTKETEKVVDAKERERKAREGAIKAQEEANQKNKKDTQEVSNFVKVFSSLAKIFQSIKKVVSSIGTAIKDSFSLKGVGDGFTLLVDKFVEFSDKLVISDETANKITDVFKEIFDVFKMVGTVAVKTLSAGFKLAIDILKPVVGLFVFLADKLGDLIVKAKDYIKENNLLVRVGKKITDTYNKVVSVLVEFYTKLTKLPAIQALKEKLKELYENVGVHLIEFFKAAKKYFDRFSANLKTKGPELMEKALERINKALEKLISLSKKASGRVKKLLDKFKNSSGLIRTETKIGSIDEDFKSIEKTSQKVSGGSGGKATEAADSFLGSIILMVKDFVTDSALLSKFKEMIMDLMDTIRTMDPAKGTLIMFSVAVIAFINAVKKITDKASGLLVSLARFPILFTDALKSITGAFKSVTKYFGRKGLAKVFEKFALIIGVVAASIVALAIVNKKYDIMPAAKALSMVMGVMTVMMVVVTALAKSTKKANKFNKAIEAYSKILVALAASIFLLSASLYALSGIKWNFDMLISLGVMVTLMVVLLGVMAAVNKLAPETQRTGIWLIFYAGAVFILVKALNLLAALDVEGLKGKMLTLFEAMGIIAMVALAANGLSFGSGFAVFSIVASIIFLEISLKWIINHGVKVKDVEDNLGSIVISLIGMLAIAGYMILVSRAMKDPNGMATVVLGTIALLFAITLSLKGLSKVPVGGIIKSVIAIGTLLGEVLGLIYLVSVYGDAAKIKAAGSLLLKLSIAIGLLSFTVAYLGSLKLDTIMQGFAVVSLLTALMLVIIYVSQIGKSMDAKGLVAMIGVISTMAIVISLMSMIDDKLSLLQSVGMLGLALISFGASIYLASKFANTHAVKSIYAMVAALVVIAGSLFALTYFNSDWTVILSAAAAMSLVLLAVGRCVQVLIEAFTKNNLNPDFLDSVVKMILGMAVIIAAIGVSLTGITAFSGGNSLAILSAAAALSLVLMALAAVLKYIANKMAGNDVNKAKENIAALHMLLIEIGVIAAAMSPLLYFSHSGRQIIAAAGSLSLVLASLVGAYFVLSLIKANGKDMMVKAGALAIMALSLLPAAAALAILAQYDTSGMIEAAKAIAIVIGVIAAALGVLMLISSTGTGFAVILAIAAAISIVALSLAVSAKIVSKAIGKIIDAIKELTKIEYDKIDTQKLNELVILLLKMSLTSLVTAIGITALGAALSVLGVGVLAVGLGLSLLIVTATGLIKALTALIKAINAMDFTKVSNGIKMVGVTLKGFITGIAASFAMAFIVFLNTLRMNIKVIGETIKDLILTILDVLISAKVDIAERIIEGLTELFSMLEEKLPPLFEHVNNLLISLLTMIAENARVYGYLGSVIAIEFAIGIMQGLSDSAEDLVDTAVWLTLSMIRAIRNTFNKYKDLLADGLKGIFFKGSAGFWKYMKAWQDVNNPLGKLLGINDFFALEANDLDETADYLFNELDEDWEAHSKEHADKHAESVAKNEETAAKNIDMSKVHDQYALKARQATDTTTESRQSAEDNVEAYNGSYTDALSRKKDELINGVKDFAVGAFTGGAAKAQPEMEVVARRSAIGLSDYTVEEMKKEGYKLNEAGTEWIKEIPKGMEEGADQQSNPFASVLGGFLGLNGDESGMGGVMSDWMGQMTTNGEDGAGNFIEGLMGKFTDQEALNNIHDATFDFGEYAKKGWDESTKTQSPSKEAIKRAGYWLEGLLIPLESSKSNKALYDASAKNAEAVKNSFTDTIKNTPEFGNNLTYTPTIKPVLDSSNMGQYGGFMDILNNPATVQLAADSQLSIRDANQFKLAQQMEQLNSNISKMANQDLSKVMEGVAINVNADTTVDGTVLRKTASRYTINQINEQEQAILMAKGARA